METRIVNATEYRNVILTLLGKSKTNPRRTFEQVALKELASSIRTQGVLSPLLVRPVTENGFEIIAGARRYRAAQMAKPRPYPSALFISPMRRSWKRTVILNAAGSSRADADCAREVKQVVITSVLPPQFIAAWV